MEARARVSAEGFIWSMNGHRAATPAPAAAAPAAMFMKSRRLGSEGVAPVLDCTTVSVTCAHPQLSACRADRPSRLNDTAPDGAICGDAAMREKARIDSPAQRPASRAPWA